MSTLHIFLVTIIMIGCYCNIIILGAENLSNNAGDSFASFQAITISGGNVYVVWSDTTTGNFEILYRRSTVDSNSFGPTENLSKDPGNSFEPRVASSIVS